MSRIADLEISPSTADGHTLSDSLVSHTRVYDAAPATGTAAAPAKAAAASKRSPDEQEAALVTMLDDVEAYMTLHKDLCDSLKQGCFNISRARYSMGAVGQAQYNMEAQATTRVRVVTSSSDEASTSGSRSSDADVTLELLVGVAPTSRPESHSDDDSDDSLDEAIRSAAAGKDSPSATTKGSSRRRRDAAGGTGGGSSGSSDPLRWFGVLVPPALRDAQSDFRTVVALAIKAANAASRARHSHQKLQHH